MQQLIFGSALFYDLPEYLQIVSSHNLIQVLSLGHFPIHPIFMGILWILIKIFPVNVIAMIFGLISIIFVYKISKSIFPTLIFALLPGVWLINTNLMVESMTLTFYITSVYFFLSKNKKLFFVSLFLMIGTHIQAIFWIPTIFIFPYILELKFNKKYIIDLIKTSLLATGFSIIFYLLIYYFSGRVIEGTTEQLSTYLSSGILRMVRNIWLSFIRDFGTFTPFILLIGILKNVKSKSIWLAWLVFFLSVGLIGANWQGDFMGRRIIFAAPILALALNKYLRKKSIFVIIYLLPIVFANIFLYTQKPPFNIPDIPRGQVLIETHFLKPFIKYTGTTLWVGESDLDVVDDYLKKGMRVFLTKQAITAPYMLLVGQNYHITSLGKVGDSETRFLFKKYQIDVYNDAFEIKAYNGKINETAGEAVIYYGERLLRRRIDYGDVGTWIWALVTNHKDSTGWIYKDVRGIWYNI